MSRRKASISGICSISLLLICLWTEDFNWFVEEIFSLSSNLPETYDYIPVKIK